MNFETEYKNIHFHIDLKRAGITNSALLLEDKFNRLGNQTIIEIKKGNLIAWNLTITSTRQSEVRVYFWSNILLSSKDEEILEELGAYLDDENILDQIVDNWNLAGDETGPAWKQAPK